MIITLNDLNNKKSCAEGIYLFQLLNLKDIDLDNKETTVYTPSNYDYLKWLCQNFNLTMIIKYNFCISKYRNGLLIHYKDSNGFEKWLEYDENNNLIYHKNSNEFEYWKKYNENNELIFINILSIRFNETI